VVGAEEEAAELLQRVLVHSSPRLPARHQADSQLQRPQGQVESCLRAPQRARKWKQPIRREGRHWTAQVQSVWATAKPVPELRNCSCILCSREVQQEAEGRRLA
jgi:hypothetical protein